MTSGLYNFTDVPEFWEEFLRGPHGHLDAAAAGRPGHRQPARLPPGQEYMYCNTNYVLLGMIIEKVTGRTAGSEVTRAHHQEARPQAHILPHDHGPARAVHARLRAGRRRAERLRRSQRLSIYSPTPFWTAGGMVSTLGDLKIWMKAIVTGKLLSKRMHAAQLQFSAPNTASYGLGVMNASGVPRSGTPARSPATTPRCTTSRPRRRSASR